MSGSNHDTQAGGQAGTVGSASVSNQPTPADASAQPNAESEEISAAANQFTRYCAGIVEKFQTGQLSISESMVQIALEISRSPITE